MFGLGRGPSLGEITFFRFPKLDGVGSNPLPAPPDPGTSTSCRNQRNPAEFTRCWTPVVNAGDHGSNGLQLI